MTRAASTNYAPRCSDAGHWRACTSASIINFDEIGQIDYSQTRHDGTSELASSENYHRIIQFFHYLSLYFLNFSEILFAKRNYFNLFIVVPKMKEQSLIDDSWNNLKHFFLQKFSLRLFFNKLLTKPFINRITVVLDIYCWSNLKKTNEFKQYVLKKIHGIHLT